MEANQLDDFDLIAKALLVQRKPPSQRVNSHAIERTPSYMTLPSELVVRRIGCDFRSQTLLIQFSRKTNLKAIKTKKIHIKRFIYKETKEVLESLRRKFPEYLSVSSSAKNDLIIEEALESLLFSQNKANNCFSEDFNKKSAKTTINTDKTQYNSTNNTNTNTFTKANTTMPRIPFSKMKEEEVDEETLLREIDLNKCSDELNQKAKQLMARDFEAKRLKPGDEGYIWNKEVHFEPAEEDNDWDEEEEDDE